MSLLLIEVESKEANSTKEGITERIENIKSKLANESSRLIEVQIAKDLSQAYIIVKTNSEKIAQSTIESEGFIVNLVKEVRLIGEELDTVEESNEEINFLVEWNLPKDLTMEAYLERKKKNSVHYDETPEVSFARTYVCEDMTKCLCFYDAPDEAAVKRARVAVKAPINAITELENKNK